MNLLKNPNDFHKNKPYPVRQTFKKTAFLRFKSAHFNELKRFSMQEARFNSLKCALLKRKNAVFSNACLPG
jgi:hypothetical protein